MQRLLARPVRVLCLIVTVFLWTSCGKEPLPSKRVEPVDPTPVTPTVLKYSVKAVEDMSLKEKIGQMFFLRVETLAGTTVAATTLTEQMTKTFADYPCGGFTLFAANILDPTQLISLARSIHKLDNYPLISIDEEGGSVARIGKNKSFPVTTYSSMFDIGSTGDPKNAFNAGSVIGDYLFRYEMDIDFAPVADVFTNPKNTVIGKRSFSSDPDIAAEMSTNFLKGLQSKTIEGCLKHFPGHGDTDSDTHYGYAESKKTWEQMLECEMIPFKKGIENGAKMIMTAHIATPAITGDETPASLSKVILTDKLRKELGFKGIIITDAIEMGAISKEYEVGEATVLAVKAGVDIILLPTNYKNAFDALLEAVNSGAISEERINESVKRIVNLKKEILKSRSILAE